MRLLPLKRKSIHVTSTWAPPCLPNFRPLLGGMFPYWYFHPKLPSQRTLCWVWADGRKECPFPFSVPAPSPVSSLPLAGQLCVARGPASSKSWELSTWELRATRLLAAPTVPFVWRMKVSARAFGRVPERVLVGAALLACIFQKRTFWWGCTEHSVSGDLLRKASRMVGQWAWERSRPGNGETLSTVHSGNEAGVTWATSRRGSLETLWVIIVFWVRCEGAPVSHWWRAASGRCKFLSSSGLWCAQAKGSSSLWATLQPRDTGAHQEPLSMGMGKVSQEYGQALTASATAADTTYPSVLLHGTQHHVKKENPFPPNV